jgi:alginate O-acetyltransferase complex protein AlgI
VLFTSIAYAIFFIVVFMLHWVLPQAWRRPFLLIASLYFYASAFPQYLALIIGLTAFNYVMGLLIARVRGRARASALTLAIVGDLGTLATFKYSQFLVNSVQSLLRAFPLLPPLGQDPITLNIVLPLGISFFTFEFIHYVVEVYKGMAAMRRPVDFALFAAFFPTQIAGPIKRFPDWVKQLKHPLPLRGVDVDGGIGLILRGLVKKVIVADTLAPAVSAMFGAPGSLGAVSAWFAVFAFATQIYCDFSGYTDIGRGSAVLLGYSVPENFNRPYQARNPSEFWHRWHMSLSTWLRDYLYIPLGGSRVPQPRIYLNLMITMALGGLWHGASWHFMVWGVYQGGLLCADRLWGRTIGTTALYQRAMRFPVLDFVRRPMTLILVCVGWILFRADSLHSAFAMLGSMFAVSRPLTAGLAHGTGWTVVLLTLAAGALVVGGWLWPFVGGPVVRWWQRVIAHVDMSWQRGLLVLALRPALYAALITLLVVWPPNDVVKFIYFQF